MPILPLIVRTSIPMMLSLITHALYNVVDSIFVSHVSEDALTALSIAGPVQQLIAAIGCGIAVGLNAMISKAMGERDTDKVRGTASAAMALAVFAGALIAGAGVLGVDAYFEWQAAGNQAIRDAGTAYLGFIMVCSVGNMLQWVFDRFLIATGKSTLFLITLSVASLVNLVLDPIFIFGWLGLPPMGTLGAAIATVIGQYCGALAGLIICLKYNREIPLRFTLRPSARRMLDILRVGVPTTVMQSVWAFSGIVMNTVLRAFSSTAVAVMGVCNRLHGLATIPTHGVDNGLIPIVAYNFGARRKDRVLSAVHCAIGLSYCMMGVVLALLLLLPREILSLFEPSEVMLTIGVPAIRVLGVAYFLSVFGMVGGTVLQALGRGDYALWLSLVRQTVLPLVLVLALSRTGQLQWVWFAFVLAEVLSAPMTAWLLAKVKRADVDTLDAP